MTIWNFDLGGAWSARDICAWANGDGIGRATFDIPLDSEFDSWWNQHHIQGARECKIPPK